MTTDKQPTPEEMTSLDSLIDEVIDKAQADAITIHDRVRGLLPADDYAASRSLAKATLKQAIEAMVVEVIGPEPEDDGSSKVFIEGRKYQQFTSRQRLNKLLKGGQAE